jgi:hypothetical protein
MYRNKLRDLMPSERTGRNISISDIRTPEEILAHLDPSTWTGFGDMNDDYAFIVFSQTELFDTDGTQVIDAAAEPRIVVVMSLDDATARNQSMQDWEQSSTMVESLRYAFDYDPADSLVQTFSDGAYRQVPLRYQNFPYADRSIDWGIITASNGQNYLVLSNSRQAFFYAYDQLLK